MLTIKRSFLSLLISTVLLSAVLAQDDRTANPTTTANPTKESQIVTASVNGERLRVTAPSSVVQLRLEVYNSARNKVFDHEVSGGNLLDWRLQDAQAQPLTDDTYLCVLTIKSLSGKLSRSLGSVRIEKDSHTLQAVDASQLTAQQVQAVGPAEEEISLTVLNEDDKQTPTVIAHNGEEGQVIRGKGALSFRLGDFFSGKDTEQMRLTPEGNVGIGIAHPQTRLDVDGVIRASGGIVFPDGTTQYSAARKTLGAQSTKPGQKPAEGEGDFEAQTGGTGTAGRLAKWTDNVGNLGDSLLSESGTDIVHNGSSIQMTAAASTTVDTNIIYLNGTNKTTGVLAGSTPSFVSSSGPYFAMRGNTYSAIASQRGLFAISGGNVSSPVGSEGAILFLTGADQLRMLINAAGRVGIGTNTPGSKLEIVDTSNAGLRVQTNIAGGTVASFGGFGTFNIDSPGIVGGRLTVSENGRVGMGNTIPAFRLDMIDANAGLRVVNSSPGGTVASFGVNGRFNIDGVGLGGRFTVLENGNTGIGVNTPPQKLSVSGTGIIRAQVNSDSNAGLGLALNNAAKWSVATVTGDAFQIFNDAAGSNAFWIDSTNNVGIGTTSPAGRLQVNAAGSNGLVVSTDTSGFFVASFGSTGSFAIDSPGVGGGRLLIDETGLVTLNNPASPPTNVVKLSINGSIKTNPATGGITPLCLSAQSNIANCSSSIRYKENVNDFAFGRDLIRRLRPVTFDWKENKMHDLGLVAEEVAKAEPLLVTHNATGEIEGVKYDRVGVVLINAFNEQQVQLEQYREQLSRQRAEIAALKRLVCAGHPNAEPCRAISPTTARHKR